MLLSDAYLRAGGTVNSNNYFVPQLFFFMLGFFLNDLEGLPLKKFGNSCCGMLLNGLHLKKTLHRYAVALQTKVIIH